MRLFELITNKTIYPVYHGTDQDFTEFKIGMKGERMILMNLVETESSGLFFSTNIEDAKSYGKNVITAKLNVKNVFLNPSQIGSSRDPKQENDKRWDDIDYIFAPKLKKDGIVSYEGGIRSVPIDDDYEWLKYAFGDHLLDWYYLDDPQFVARMRSRGYDCVKVYEPNDRSGFSWFVTDIGAIQILKISK